MTICDLCGNDMTTGAGCVVGALHQEGRPYELAPHERRRGTGAHDENCGDCSVAPGGLHHLGCDMQTCPKCRGQLLICDCRFDELPVDDDEFGEAYDGFAALSPQPTPFVSGKHVPFGAAVAPLRARHQWALAELASRHLPSGAPLDIGLAAALVELVFNRRAAISAPDSVSDSVVGVAAGVVLHRPDVNDLLRVAIFNWCSLQGILVPPDVPEHLWVVVEWIAESGRLRAGSDPVSALLEPLQCAGGLDAIGRPRSADELSPVHCQCVLPFDPNVPPGVIARAVGWLDGRCLVEHVHPPALDERDGAEVLAPLLILAGRLSRHGSEMHIDPSEWTFAGRRDARRNDPTLWFYRHEPSRHREYAALVLDAVGAVHVARPDRRRKAGYRWVPAHDWALLRSAPIEAVVGARCQPFGLKAAPEPGGDVMRWA